MPDAAIDPGALSVLLGLPIVAAEPARYGDSARTAIVATADGRRLAVKLLGDPVTARHRVSLATALPPLLGPIGVPSPAVVAADPTARPPYVASVHIRGRSGADCLSDPVDAIALGTEMGRLLRRLRTAPTAGLRLPTTWADPARLAAVGRRWLDRARPHLDPPSTRELEGSLARLPSLFAGRPAVLAHGDWAPVNAVVEGRAVVAVLDWDCARLADPLLDVAWWGALVFSFHPDAWPHAWPAFLETTGVTLDRPTIERLRVLGSLRLLEVLASRRVLGAQAHAHDWAGRIRSLLDAEG